MTTIRQRLVAAIWCLLGHGVAFNLQIVARDNSVNLSGNSNSTLFMGCNFSCARQVFRENELQIFCQKENEND